MFRDFRYAARTLRRSPGFALVAVLTLALGIGANSAIFSVINTLLLRPPAFEHLNRLVVLFETNPQKGWNDVYPSPGNFLDWREQSRSLDYVSGWRNWYYTLSGPEGRAGLPEQIRGVRISPSFFSMLGVRAALGRTFQREEEEPGRDQVVILTDGLWKRRFGADAAIVGEKVLIDSRPASVIGVLPADFYFLQADFDIWMPLTVDQALHDRVEHSINVFARLGPGVSMAQAQAEMEAIARGLEQAHPETNGGFGARIGRIYPTAAVKTMRPALLVLLGAAGFVLLIACANVANLLLARAVSRQREIAIRTAIGATRFRLIRQMLTESVLLAGIGGAAGLLLAHWALRLLVPLIPHISAYRALAPTIDSRVLGFTLAVALSTGVVFGLAPALQATRAEFLRVSASFHRRAAGDFLMVSEIALSIVLLIGAALLLKSFWHLQKIDPGFRPDHLLTMQVWLPKTKYPEASKVAGFYRQVVQRIEALPGVRAASAVNFRPFLGWGDGTLLDIEGHVPQSPSEALQAQYRVVTPGYFRTLGVPLLQGRDLTESDGPTSAGVAVINETMARRFWPNENPIGKHIRPAFRKTQVPWRPDATARWLTIIGVVGDVKEFRLNDPSPPEMYLSYLQSPSSLMFLVVRTASFPATLAATVQSEIRQVDRDQPVSDIRTMDAALSDAVAQPRFNLQLLGVFAALAVILSAVGVYGVTSYAVTQRTREIGIRMALGAEPSDVLGMMARQGLRLILIGVLIGLAAAAGLTRVLSSLLFGVSPTDPAIFAGVTLLLVAIAMLAGYLPARRAARVDPMTALRQE